MRVSPSKAQTDYLRSVGVFEPVASSKPPRTSSPPKPVSKADSTSPWRSVGRVKWIVIWAIVLVLLVLVGLTYGQELTNPQAITSDQPPMFADKGYATEETNIPSDSEAGADNAFVAPLGGPDDLFWYLWTVPAPKIAPALPSGSDNASLAQQKNAQTGSSNNGFSLADDYRRLAEHLHDLETTRHADALARILDRRDSEASVTVILQEVRSQSLLFSGVAVLLAALLTALIYERTKRMKKSDPSSGSSTGLETSSNNSLSETAIGNVEVGAINTRTQPRPTTIGDIAKRAPADVPLGWPEIQEELVANARKLVNCLKVAPTLPTRMWQLGVVSLKGEVRPQNQDVAVTFSIGECDVLIIADGCGGIPRGREAAWLAAESTALRLVQILGTSAGETPKVEEALQSAIWAAHHQLAIRGDKYNITCDDINGGLRTTLVVVVGQLDRLHYGYIGDGGGFLLRTNGKLERFLAPQKASGSLNILDASLGPLMAGKPIMGMLNRNAGDLALVGTDGIFDRIPPKDMEVFAKDVLRSCICQNGDLQAVAHQICEEYVAQKDAIGYICDDNLTLGLMGTRTRPILGPGFWTSITPPIFQHSEVIEKGRADEKQIVEDRARNSLALG